MAILQKFQPKILYQAPLLMYSITSHSTLKSLLFSPNFRRFTPSFLYFTNTHLPFQDRSCKKRPQVSVSVSDLQLKENWLDSLSSPFGERVGQIGINSEAALSVGAGPEWVVGIDPDISGAVAVLKDDCSLLSAQVFDTPHLQVLVGKRVRKRWDARSIVQLLHSFGLPHGTIACIEQSRPFPKDGKQGWWCGGFGYGLWTGILVASGFSVVPVSSLLWKNQFELRGTSSTKDESRNVASALFPSLSSLLKRKKDHGRAEALLIAAYGKGLKKPS